MSTFELIDELEAGELSVAFEGEDPEDLLEWAMERFNPRLGISTAFQIDGVALIDMAYKLDPSIKVFSVDTGMLPKEPHELIARLRKHYPGLDLELVKPHEPHIETMAARKGLNLMYENGENRLLCCNV